MIYIPHAKEPPKKVLSALAAVELKLLPHEITWSSSLSDAHNAALELAAAAGKGDDYYWLEYISGI